MLQTLPLVCILGGLVLYVVLAGADFGAGVWLLSAGRGERGERVREHAHHAMGPVWEANHVWLIFVLTVSWTAYPAFVGAVGSTLGVVLFIAGLGIVVRGAGYALRSGTGGGVTLRAIDRSFAVASLLTPFALGAAAGAIASLRVTAAGSGSHPFSSWLNPTSILIGVLAVTFSAYLAAVFLAADADRIGDIELTAAFQRRAIGSGALAGIVALAGLFVLHGDARSLLNGLLSGGALAAVIGSALAGVLALALVWRGRFEPARYTAAAAVATVVAGWALARYPTLLRGLTVSGAAAPHDTLVALLVAIAAGGVLLFPSLGWLFSLQLTGGFDGGTPGSEASGDSARAAAERRNVPALPARVPVALAVLGIGLLNVASAPWAHGIGVLALIAAVTGGVMAIVPRALADADRSA